METRLYLTLAALGVLLVLASAASAQNVETIECQEGDVLTASYADVIVNGVSCTLNGATVTGSVLVSSFGTLTASGTQVLGSIQATGAYDIRLEATDVSGAVSMKDSRDLTIEASASTGEVLVENSGNVSVSNGAQVAAIFSTRSGGINLTTNARVFPGGVTMSFSSGSLVICGSEIGINSDTLTDGSGGVQVIESGKVGAPVNVLAVAEGLCAASQIEGSVIVQKGAGDVRFAGAELLAGDLIVSDQTGNVEVDGSSLSDVKIENIGGWVMLKTVTSNSDTSIVDNGDVTIKSSELSGDMNVSFNGMVTITGNSFSLEDVRISSNDGPVVIDRNCDMRLTVIENNVVTITNNNPTDATTEGATCTSGFGFTDADVSKNMGGVMITNNTGEGLFCSDNDPTPTDGGRNIFTFTDGQCAGFTTQ